MLIILAFFLAALGTATRHNNRYVWVFDPTPQSTDISYLYPKESVFVCAQSSNWSVRKVNPSNINFWLQKSHSSLIENMMKVLQKKDNFIKYKDLIKCLILQHYGGLWVDDNIVLTGNLEWLQNYKSLKNSKWKSTNNPEIIAFWKNDEDISLNFVWASEHAEFFSKLLLKLEDADLLDDFDSLNSYLGRLLKKELGDGKQLIQNNDVWVIMEEQTLPFRDFNSDEDTSAKLDQLKSTRSQIKKWDIPKIVWVYWDEGIFTASFFIKECRQNIKFFTQLRGWELRELDSFNIKEELSKIPNSANILKAINKQKQFTQHKSDLIKLAILHNYGGVWLDSDIVLMQDFLWVQQIFTQHAIEFKTEQMPEVLAPYSTYENIQINQQKRQIPRLETYFMAVSPKSQFLQDVLAQYLVIADMQKEDLENRLKSDKIEIDALTLALAEDNGINIAMSTVFQKKRQSISRQSNNVLSTYKIWIFTDTLGPSKLKAQNPLVMVKLFTNSTINELEKNNQNPKYFIKFTSSESNYVSERIMKAKECSFNKEPAKCDHSHHSLYQIYLEDIKVFESVERLKGGQSEEASKVTERQGKEEKEMSRGREQESQTSWLGILMVGVIIIIFLKKVVIDKLSQFSSDSQTRNYNNDIAYSSKNFSSI